MSAEISWPEKTRDIRHVVMDSTCWEGFEHREGDIFVATFGKSGSTWTQQIVAKIAKADRFAAEHLTPECAHWLKTGEMAA
jgi:hypothetical protein